MPEVTGRVVTLKFIVNLLAGRSDVGPNTVVTLSQEMIDDIERVSQTAREVTDKFESVSVGFTTLEPGQCCERDFDRDGNCDRHPKQ